MIYELQMGGKMDNLIVRTTALDMSVMLSYIRKGDTVVDATCGSGHDTLTLAQAVGEEGQVLAFDIQEQAIEQTEARLRSRGISNVRLLLDSFVSMTSCLPENSASAVVFNLGYLPGGDHGITTLAEITLEGMDAALRTIRPGGVVTFVLYDGHENGAEEKRQLLTRAEELDSSRYHAAYVSMLNQKRHPPEILWITKKRG